MTDPPSPPPEDWRTRWKEWTMPNTTNLIWILVGILVAAVAIVWLIQNVSVN